jgi:hypothetical protein
MKQLVLSVVIGAALAVGGGVGCIKKPIEGRAELYPSSQINFADEDLRRKTTVGTPVVNRDSEGQILFVTVPIRAATNLQLHVQYRVTFVDAYGQLVWESTWFTKTLTPNVFDQVQVNSPSPRAADFRVDFRYASYR